ncbi:MAG: fucose isomerase [Clostridiales bacterium]|jgi:L-fucose mutarotase|nr:fucose isomerase [Clostridiales bacterium]
MLKGIPGILSPDLLKILMEMGHGDEIVIADGNYPAAGNARRLVRLDGHGAIEVAEAILKFLPLDAYVEEPALLMSVVPGDDVVPTIWDEYRTLVETYEPGTKIGFLDRFAFYERAKAAYAIVATGESALYANILLKKGVIR